MQNTEITILERYFPQTFEDLLLPVRIKNILNKNINKIGYRLLLFSSPGTGKTTTSRLMTQDKIKNEILYLSGSNDFNIETLRGKIMSFASGMSVLQKQKTIIIDEFENIRDNLQDSFKIILDKCVTVNFIFITNEVEKVNEAVKSRCTCIDYDFVNLDLEEQKKNFINFAIKVCNEEKIVYDKLGMRSLFQLNFPDFRHLLVDLQQIQDSNESVTLDSIKKLSESAKMDLELYKIVETPSILGKEFFVEISKYKTKERDALLSLGEPFFQYLNEKELFEKTLNAAIIVSKYSDSFMNSMNKFVTLMSCVIELKTLFR